MKRVIALFVLLSITGAGSLAAQTPAANPRPAAPKATPTEELERKISEQAQRREREREQLEDALRNKKEAEEYSRRENEKAAAELLGRNGQVVNIRLDLSVIDQVSVGSPKPKTLMVLLADRAMSRMRSQFEEQMINVDARPTLVEGRVRLELTVASTPPMKPIPMMPVEKGEKPDLNSWSHTFALILESGKSLVAFETSDAATNRKMSIEVKATVLK